MLKNSVSEYRLDNWVTTASFGYSDSSVLYCLTSHNIVLKIDAMTGEVEKKLTCDERSILYSGALKPLPSGEILVASGTVLGGVVIWDLFSGTIQHNFTSHEGSIFGLAFSDSGDTLVSCSDDRSIRLWDLVSGNQMATGWGHLARIWDLHFYRDHIVSVSEDCSARVWNFNGEALETDEVLEGHLGRNVWCGAIDHENGLLATGGGDGRIRLWDLERKAVIDKYRETISLEDTEKDISTPLVKSEVFKNYTQMKGSMVVATSTGRVIVLGPNMKFRQVDLSENEVDTYLIVKGWEEINVSAIASRNGQVYLLHLSKEDQVLPVNNDLQAKLTDILTWSLNGRHYLLAQSQNPQDPFIVSELKMGEDGILCLLNQYTLEPPSTFLSTSAAMFDETTLFLGSRHGGLVAYNLKESLAPITCWRHVAGSSDSITSLIFNNDSLHFTTRGGQFAVGVVEKTNQKFILTVVSSNKLQRGSIEGSIFANNQKILYGFRNDLFFIWNETNQYEIANEKCGGPHRAWQLTLNESDEYHYRLIYTKASKVVLLSSDCLPKKFSNTLLQDGTHGREIRDIAIGPQLLPFGRIVATASEDTCIKLATIGHDTPFHNQCTLRMHISGLQKLRWSSDGVYLYSSAAREEFVVWKVSLTTDYNIYATPVASLPTSSDNPDLRIMNFLLTTLTAHLTLIVTVYSDSAIRLWLFNNKNYSFQQIGSGTYRNCCLLNVDLVLSRSKPFLLISATDGHLISWNIETLLISAGIKVANDQFSVADLDLNLPVVSLSDPIFRHKIHQSSVKDSVIYGPLDEIYYHVSGGDDNSLSLTKINYTDGTATKVFSVPSAHSSTITGISVIPGSLTSFVTVGVDQNVKLWKIPEQWNSIDLVDSKYTTVADTGALDIALFEHNNVGITVAGSGLSFWTIKY